jgi:hypothetical protein
MCIYGESLSCSHAECQSPCLSYNPYMPFDTILINKLYEVLQVQNQDLQSIFEKNRLLSSAVDSLVQKVKMLERIKEESIVPINSNTTLDIILREESYEFAISLVENLPEVILKEKGFKLTIGLLDLTQKRIHIPVEFKFRLELFTMDEPAKLLESNIHGKKILRGTISAHSLDHWTVTFTNVVINEVSSHYSNDSLRIVVFLNGSHIVKPLILNNVSIRARKNINK